MTTTEFVCQRCVYVFSFNNRFYKHICKCVKFALLINSTNFSILTEAYSNNTHDFESLIRFKVNSNKNIKTKYDFKK